MSDETDELWRRGRLRFKMHPVQRQMYDAFKSTKTKSFTFECGRRLGKTWLMALISTEACLQNPGCTVIYGAPTLKALARFVLPAFEAIVADAPIDVRPVYVASKGEWRFPNGARIILFGADNKRTAERGRGDNAILCVADEAGFFPVELLRYVLSSVFKPSMQLMKGRGRTIIASTPSPIPEHDFTEICEKAESRGNYARYTVYDNPMLTPADIEAFIAEDAEELGLSVDDYKDSTTFQREYLAKRVVDKMLVVVPEWGVVRDTCFTDIARPQYFDGLTTLDFGGADPHAVLFGYWHFEAAKLVVEDELLLRHGENTAELAARVKAKELELWGTETHDGSLRIGKEEPLILPNLPPWLNDILLKEAPQQPYARFCDNDLQLATDLHTIYGISVIPTRKDDLEHQVQFLRTLVGDRKVLVSKKCVNTDRHLVGTTWANHRRQTFSRKANEHGDCLAALIYKARNVTEAGIRARNPTPAHKRPQLTPLQQHRLAQEIDESVPSVFRTPLGRRLFG